MQPVIIRTFFIFSFFFCPLQILCFSPILRPRSILFSIPIVCPSAHPSHKTKERERKRERELMKRAKKGRRKGKRKNPEISAQFGGRLLTYLLVHFWLLDFLAGAVGAFFLLVFEHSLSCWFWFWLFDLSLQLPLWFILSRSSPLCYGMGWTGLAWLGMVWYDTIATPSPFSSSIFFFLRQDGCLWCGCVGEWGGGMKRNFFIPQLDCAQNCIHTTLPGQL